MKAPWHRARHINPTLCQGVTSGRRDGHRGLAGQGLWSLREQIDQCPQLVGPASRVELPSSTVDSRRKRAPSAHQVRGARQSLLPQPAPAFQPRPRIGDRGCEAPSLDPAPGSPSRGRENSAVASVPGFLPFRNEAPHFNTSNEHYQEMKMYDCSLTAPRSQSTFV